MIGSYSRLSAAAGEKGLMFKRKGLMFGCKKLLFRRKGLLFGCKRLDVRARIFAHLNRAF